MTAEVSAKENEISTLQSRLSQVSNESRLLISEYTRQNSELERELRWAKEGRQAAEKREEIARREVAALSSVSVIYTNCKVFPLLDAGCGNRHEQK